MATHNTRTYENPMDGGGLVQATIHWGCKELGTLQGIFPTQGLSSRQILCQSELPGKPKVQPTDFQMLSGNIFSHFEIFLHI